MKEKERIYMCFPYSHPDPAVMHQRFLQANDLAGRLVEAGYIVFSPISHSVPIADQMGNHLSHEVWLEQDYAFIDWCDSLWIPKVEGWIESKGIALEFFYAKKIGKRIVYFRPVGENEIEIC